VRLDHRIGRWTRWSLERVANELRAILDQEYHDHGPFERVVLMGHSVGGLLVRRVFLDGARKGEPWASRVERVVLLAGLSRGYLVGLRGRAIEDPKARKLKLLADFGCRAVLPAANSLSGLGIPRLTITDAIAGSEFVTSLRLRWMHEFPRLPRPPVVVQVLGTDDEFVEPEDALDLAQFPGCGIVRVPGADHETVLDVRGERAAHYRPIRRAVLDPPESADSPAPTDPRPVVFLLHGIHANRYGWVAKMRDHLLAHHPQFEVFDRSYGAFTFLDFVRPGRRHAYASWFLDQYTQAMARNPGQPLHFVGHSFGTFVLGNGLLRYADIRFDRVVLAGTVLPTGYDWAERHRQGQVACLRNVMATKDVPVAILSRGLGWLNRNEIGSAGFHGFENLEPQMQEYRQVGGHGAAFDRPEDYERIAAFLSQGYAATDRNEQDHPSTLMRIASGLATLYVPLLVAGLVLGVPLLLLTGKAEAAALVGAALGIALIGAQAFSR
jgi:pimeloyl-ACP methyl ester carboxylesterase